MIFRPVSYFDLGSAAYLFGRGMKPADMERILAWNRGHREVEASPRPR